MLDCCKCTCNPNCYRSIFYVPSIFTKEMCKAYLKLPHCKDDSDENIHVCCTGDYPAYSDTICNDLHFIERYKNALPG